MKTNKTYKTLASAYTSAQKAGAKSFGSDYYAYANRVDEILASIYKSASARTLAKWNLAKYEKTLCALECTKDGAYKWTVIGHFDSDGLLYAEMPTQVEENKATPRKRTRKEKGDNKPTKTEWQMSVDEYAGTGRASNHKVAKILRKHKMSAQIGSEGWTYWESIR